MVCVPASPFLAQTPSSSAATSRALAAQAGHFTCPCASGRCGHHGTIQRQYSNTLRTQRTLQMPRQSSRCCAVPEALDLVSSASAAISSFDDVCEAFGDIAKLDSVIARAASSAVVVPLPQSAPVGLDMSAALTWGVEKVVGSLASLAFFEGLVDKTVIDLYQQVFSALELADHAFDTPWLRAAAAVAVAAVVHRTISGYKAANPQKLQKQLSPAASLTDVLAEQTAAAVLHATGLALNYQQQNTQQLNQQQKAAGHDIVGADRQLQVAGLTCLTCGPSSSACSTTAASLGPVDKTTTPQDDAATAAKSLHGSVGPAALVTSAMLLLGQVKRANKLRKQVAAVVAEVTQPGGQLSPVVLIVMIEAAALAHSYSEMVSGMAALLHLRG